MKGKFIEKEKVLKLIFVEYPQVAQRAGELIRIMARENVITKSMIDVILQAAYKSDSETQQQIYKPFEDISIHLNTDIVDYLY